MEVNPVHSENIQVKKGKQRISAALREQVWLRHMGRAFEGKCMTSWCQNKITVFDFECGHDIPESKGGPTDIRNLYPICRKCNGSMGNRYTFNEWTKLHTYTPAGHPLPTVETVVPSKNTFWSICFCMP